MAKRWRIHPHDSARISLLAQAAGISPVVARLLICRGLVDPVQARNFLDPKLTALRDPGELPGVPAAVERISAAIARRERTGHHHAVVVVAEGARPLAGQRSVQAAAEAGRAERLGGIGAQVEAELAALTGKECRSVVLGHLLRGGSPSDFDRVCASRFGAAAVRALADGQAGVMVALGWKAIDLVPLSQVAGRTKTVQVDGDTVATARELGISLGD